MHADWLGDSYDAVKRMWSSLLETTAKLYADPFFIPLGIQEDFTKLTGIEMLPQNVENRETHSVLLDPNTGWSLSRLRNQQDHVGLEKIRSTLDDQRVTCVIVFDQSFRRSKKQTLHEQRQTKLLKLSSLGLCGFYFASHAPFLFAFRTEDQLNLVESILLEARIPRKKIERCKD